MTINSRIKQGSALERSIASSGLSNRSVWGNIVHLGPRNSAANTQTDSNTDLQAVKVTPMIRTLGGRKMLNELSRELKAQGAPDKMPEGFQFYLGILPILERHGNLLIEADFEDDELDPCICVALKTASRCLDIRIRDDAELFLSVLRSRKCADFVSFDFHDTVQLESAFRWLREDAA